MSVEGYPIHPGLLEARVGQASDLYVRSVMGNSGLRRPIIAGRQYDSRHGGAEADVEQLDEGSKSGSKES